MLLLSIQNAFFNKWFLPTLKRFFLKVLQGWRYFTSILNDVSGRCK